MAALVTIESKSGTLARYETGGAKARLTHRCTMGEPCVFNAGLVEQFRVDPPEKFAHAPNGGNEAA